MGTIEDIIEKIGDKFNDIRDDVRERIIKNADDSLIVSNNLNSSLELIDEIKKELETNFNVFSEIEQLYLSSLKKKIATESQNINQKAISIKRTYGD